MGLGEAMTVAGLGSRRGVAVEEVLLAVAAALRAHGSARLDALATLPAKAGERAFAEAARRLGLPLIVVAPEAGDERLLTRSAASQAAMGTGSASEAAALAAAGPGAVLLGPRLAVGRVTCAIASGGRP